MTFPHEPKIDWAVGDEPTNQDLNQIGGNLNFLKSLIDALNGSLSDHTSASAPHGGHVKKSGDTMTGPLAFNHPVGDSSVIDSDSSSGRQYLRIRAAGLFGGGGGGLIYVYGPNDNANPGNILIYAGEGLAQRIFADRSIRFYGDMQVDGNLTGVTAGMVGAAPANHTHTVPTSWLKTSTASASGSVSAGARDVIVMHRKSFFPNFHTTSPNLVITGHTSNVSDYVSRLGIGNQGSASLNYVIRWEYMSSTNTLRTLLLVNADGDIVGAIMDGGGNEEFVAECKAQLEQRAEDGWKVVEVSIEDIASVLVIPGIDVAETLAQHDQTVIDASMLLEFRYDGKLIAR